ncbi:hypothetical protein F8M41_022098 [Gigaspora margarita]|uniref:Uncharacterized protein n=1 Tax=Gigaspora margarita TaxID=4874 RepID=A0A8H4AFN4_GIGMA|nr:hypothetical protein F8M41_022098 [Gigaspora margarita]
MFVFLITVFLQLLLFYVKPLVSSPLPIINHNYGEVTTYSSSNALQKRGYKSAWVFWYYNGSERDCGNYCLISFCIGSFIILLIILLGIYRCYRIRKFYSTGKFSWETTHHNTDSFIENEGDESEHEARRERDRRERRQDTEPSIPQTPPPPYPGNDRKE